MAVKGASAFFGSPAALRRMIAGQELAARVSREAAVVPTPEQAFEAALDLWSLCPERLLSPPDAVRTREVEQARAASKKLKERDEAKRAALRAAIEEGEAGGVDEGNPFDRVRSRVGLAQR
jgi:hypothetical protein